MIYHSKGYTSLLLVHAHGPCGGSRKFNNNLIGIALIQYYRYALAKITWSGQLAIFHSPSYATRLYGYEGGGFPNYFGQIVYRRSGFRWSNALTWRFKRSFKIIGKYVYTHVLPPKSPEHTFQEPLPAHQLTIHLDYKWTEI